MKIDGPFPLQVRATAEGAEIDVTTFLVRAVLTELITKAYEDPEGFTEELADLYELHRSAIHQGRDSHARHELDDRMDKLVDEFAAGGSIPLYGAAVGQMRDALATITAPRPVPAQQDRRAS
jgi:adenine-specific DNA methylase